MKLYKVYPVIMFIIGMSTSIHAQTALKKNESTTKPAEQLYIDVHHLEAGKVSTEDVAAAHQKDLAVQRRHGVRFIRYWVDEERGDVYCLSSAPKPEAIVHTHAEAHGLLPDDVWVVSEGVAAEIKGDKQLFLDIHELGAGNVTKEAVADAHAHDLAVQKKYGVNFINYWVNEKDGIVVCLSEAKDAADVIATHKEAHGLIPSSVSTVIQGD